MSCIECKKRLSGKQLKYCSRKCKCSFFLRKRRTDNKLKAIALLGNECNNCGYNKCIDALEFNHKGDKEFQVSKMWNSKGWEAIKKEILKCDLLCANCHREHHSKRRDL